MANKLYISPETTKVFLTIKPMMITASQRSNGFKVDNNPDNGLDSDEIMSKGNSSPGLWD